MKNALVVLLGMVMTSCTYAPTRYQYNDNSTTIHPERSKQLQEYRQEPLECGKYSNYSNPYNYVMDPNDSSNVYRAPVYGRGANYAEVYNYYLASHGKR
jgi:hypothetical protein